MSEPIEVSVKDSPEVAAKLDEAARIIASMDKDRMDMRKALDESGGEIERLRGVVHDQQASINDLRSGNLKPSELEVGELCIGGKSLTREQVIAGIIERIAPEIYMHCLRVGVNGTEGMHIEAAFLLAERIYDGGARAGIYEASERRPQDHELARALHEAGRAAVAEGLTQNPGGVFIEWADAPERTKAGRIMQAQQLLRTYRISAL